MEPFIIATALLTLIAVIGGLAYLLAQIFGLFENPGRVSVFFGGVFLLENHGHIVALLLTVLFALLIVQAHKRKKA